ncbi:hypothetical protein BHE74_00046320 [Ensete ventricosum]|nr:hypothetical protein BHE74_00046320 [Ensete ventricosum]
MKDPCNTRVRKDDEGYYALQITDLTPKDPDSAFGRGVLHLNLAKELYTLPSEVLMAQVAKQIVWGLCRMGQLSYEYGYYVTLAHFQAWYPDLEVDANPFTEKPEDNSVPMETRQEFDDSLPPEA